MPSPAYYIIDVTEQDLERLTQAAIRALCSNTSALKLFRFGNRIVRLERDDQGHAILRDVDEHVMRHHLAQAAKWQRSGAHDKAYAVFPPQAVVRNVLATPDLPFPVIDHFADSPIFSPSGALLKKATYQPSGRVLCVPPAGFQLRPVSQRPGPDEIAEARLTILDELLGDFPFVDSSDRAHAFAALLLPFARLLIEGPTPLHLIDKPAPGTGATMLAQVSAYVALGREVPIMTEAREEEEWRRRLLAKFRSGARVVVIDNLTKLLSSAAFSGAITSSVFEDRQIRTSEILRVPVKCLWLATGNNTALSNDLARRTVRIRLDAHVDKPWLRDGFRHSDLPQWARESHSNLVWSALTIIQAWLAADRPAGHTKLGMFESWSEVMGGILDLVGVEGFLRGLDKAYEDIDEEARFWTAFTTDWWAAHQDKEVTTAALLSLTGELLVDDNDTQGAKIKLGRQLRRMRDRQFNGLRIVQAGIRHGSQVWKLVRVGDGGVEGVEGVVQDSAE